MANSAKRLGGRLWTATTPTHRRSSTSSAAAAAEATTPNPPRRKAPNSTPYPNNLDLQRQERVETWKQQLFLVDSQIHKSLEIGEQSKNPNNIKEGLASRQLIQSVEKVVHDYRVLVSHLVRQYHQQQRQSTSNLHHQSRITGALLTQMPAVGKPILESIEKIQMAYFKSYTNRFYTLHRVLRSETTQEQNNKSHIGSDQRSSTTINHEIQRCRADAIQNKRYGRSINSSKVKRELPAEARLDRKGRFELRKLAVYKNIRLLHELWVEVGRVLEEAISIPNKSKKPKRVFGTVACHWMPISSFTKRGQLHRRFGVLQPRDRVLAAMMETTICPAMESQADPHSFAWRHSRGPFMGSSYVASLLQHCYQSHPHIMRIEIDNAFDNVSHTALLQSCPLAAKYQPFLRDFLTAKRYGERRIGDKPTSWNCSQKGVLFDEPLGRKLVNCALDGLEDFVLAPSLSGVSVVRYGTSILVVGTASRDVFEQIYKQVVVFLEGLGLRPLATTMKDETLPIFRFRRGTAFNFVGFRYLFTEFDMNRRFSKGHWTRGQTFVKSTDFQVMIAPASYQLCKEMVQRTLTKQFTSASVERIIVQYNRTFEKIASYFLVSPAAWRQLKTLYYRSFMKMKKLLRWKFSSSPSLATFIRVKFFGQGKSGNADLRIQSGDGSVRMSKPSDFFHLRDVTLSSAPFAAKAPTEEFLESSVYLLLSEEGTCKDEEFLGTSPSAPPWIDNAFRPEMWLSDGRHE